ncbi:hypothetical protein [Dyella mobilis]|uniref:Uncharacterized protein n=1 Tax=Dyella mobilis TaxID=1849582 RepID=A0ABS2KEZ7_9GAMM|nr:hypothetical protein [Dyella mobilis]MBM7129620.1 hypothetical protein [Dyella mobilis]GLQ98115.1 hypothetical protein GCM10007863_25350 [Dyella mobilis]
MVQIKHQTLIVAIQAVDAQIRAMHIDFADESDPMAFQILDDWQQAADDLERAYGELASTVINLPAYNELVGQ